ncbi:uncharacterized protein LOC142236976 [Haematobia irritans]|uniref:uncharacterized protein LOC142236976 n=1 Tax=Haematobia irritans TaxID=7368 RepID=UPI003F4F4950
MPFKFVALCTLFAMANAGYVAPVTTYAAAAPVVTKVVNPSVDAVASTQQNVVRSFGGTVSHYSKSVETPYSSVHKVDTRINNNVYTPALAKTFTYAAPAVAKTFTYAAPAVTKTVYSHEAPAVYSHAAPTVYATPAVGKTVYSHESPAVYSHAAPAVYSHAVPSIYAAPAVAKTITYAAPTATTTYNHGTSATTYSHNAPGVTGYGTSQTVHYSPAEMVSHMSFDGFGTHWGF